MAQTAVIHARIDPDTKERTERVLDSLGLTPTEAIRLLYRQIALRGEFPLELKLPNSETTALLKSIEQGENVETFDNTEKLFESWD